ncbi:MAG: co-chaperone GroES [Spirochaetia bacterium]
MTIKPLADRVLVKVELSEKKTASGLFIPDTAQEKTQTGVVVSIGDDKELIKVSVGEKIMFNKYAGTGIKIDSVDHLILESKDIIAVIN